MNIRWNQIALAVAAGFLLGAVSAGIYLVHRFHSLPPFAGGGPVEMFSRRLGLTEQQKIEVAAVFKKYAPEIEKVMQPREPQLQELLKRIKAELVPILTPEQTRKLQKLEEKIRSRHKKLSGRFGKPGLHGAWTE